MTIINSDANLVDRLSKGEEDAFEDLYKMYVGPLYRTANALLANRDEAEDAVQETFVALVRYHKNLSEVSNLKAYVYSILRNQVNRIGRLKSKDLETVNNFTAEQSLNLSANHQKGTLKHALDLLPLDQAEVIALKIGAGMTFKEIGQVLNISINTAASRYRYALERLKQDYEVKNDR